MAVVRSTSGEGVTVPGRVQVTDPGQFADAVTVTSGPAAVDLPVTVAFRDFGSAGAIHVQVRLVASVSASSTMLLTLTEGHGFLTVSSSGVAGSLGGQVALTLPGVALTAEDLLKTFHGATAPPVRSPAPTSP